MFFAIYSPLIYWVIMTLLTANNDIISSCVSILADHALLCDKGVVCSVFMFFVWHHLIGGQSVSVGAGLVRHYQAPAPFVCLFLLLAHYHPKILARKSLYFCYWCVMKRRLMGDGGRMCMCGDLLRYQTTNYIGVLVFS